MLDYIIHVLITLVAIPMVMFFFMRLVNKADAYKKKEEAQWRQQVINRFASLENKLSSYCTQNSHEHNELYDAKNTIDKRVTSIETIHKQRGCDRPQWRQGSDA